MNFIEQARSRHDCSRALEGGPHTADAAQAETDRITALGQGEDRRRQGLVQLWLLMSRIIRDDGADALGKVSKELSADHAHEACINQPHLAPPMRLLLVAGVKEIVEVLELLAHLVIFLAQVLRLLAARDDERLLEGERAHLCLLVPVEGKRHRLHASFRRRVHVPHADEAVPLPGIVGGGRLRAKGNLTQILKSVIELGTHGR